MTPDRSEEAKKAVTRGSALPMPSGARCFTCAKVVKDPDAPPGFCCSSCSDAKMGELSQKKLRELVLARDKGVCAECGADTLELLSDLNQVRGDPRLFSSRVHLLVRLGFPRGALERGETLWEADHKIERAAGGLSTAQQMQSLCLACHSRKTSSFAVKRADARRPSNRGHRPRRRFGHG